MRNSTSIALARTFPAVLSIQLTAEKIMKIGRYIKSNAFRRDIQITRIYTTKILLYCFGNCLINIGADFIGLRPLIFPLKNYPVYWQNRNLF